MAKKSARQKRKRRRKIMLFWVYVVLQIGVTCFKIIISQDK
ncbi:MAG TPA: hypothetical protein VD996_12800 [Chitinophagaceae bacterium]|nr:hypothetical protein [Chitinophagaceae bacterium]